MSAGTILGAGLRIAKPVKRKVFVSYHHGEDRNYYESFSRAFHDTYEIVYDNSIERQIDSNNVEYVIQRIRENYITGSSCTMVMVGRATLGRKFVDWEIKATLDKEHGLIGVRLPTAPVTQQNTIIVPDRLHRNIQSGYALWLTWEQITMSASHLARYIEDANARDKRLIQNTHERRLRNA